MNGKRSHHDLLVLLLATLTAIIRNTTATSQTQKAFVVACYDTGLINTTITVRVSGITDQETISVPKFQEKSSKSATASDNISYGFKSYEGSFELDKTCAFTAHKSKLGGYFVNVESTLTAQSDITTQVTYETGHVLEGYTAIPISNLGEEYYAVTFCEVFGHCQIFIVAIDDIQTINITLPNTEKIHNVKYGPDVHQKGDIITTSLAAEESILIECECDLTGTHIQSVGDVAVFSGSRDAAVGFKKHTNFLVEQLPPFAKWGTEYACSCKPYCTKHGAFIRVLGKHGTTIHISGYNKVKTTATISWIHRRIEQDDAVFITADQPVLVIMFLLGDQTYPSSMFLIPPIKDQMNRMFFQYPTDSLNTMEMTVISPGDVTGYLASQTPITVQQQFHFEGSHLFAGLIKLPGQLASREVIIEKNGSRFGIIGISTRPAIGSGTTTSSRIGFSLGSFHNIDADKDAPAYPGDGVDNDNDGEIDEDDCVASSSQNYLTNDCSLNSGSDKDEKGFRFFVIFPYFDTPIRFTVDVMSNADSTDSQVTDQHHGECPDQCNVNREQTVKGSTVYKYVDSCLCMGINFTGVVRLGTELSFSTAEHTVSVSIQGAATMATYMALPVDALGREYYAVTYCRHGGHCVCAVSTTFHSTNVFVKLPLDAGATVGEDQYTAGEVIRQTLEIFQTLIFSSTNDLTGTYIRANVPVAVVCGGNSTYATYLEQMPPVLALGLHYVIPVISGVLIRVVATDGNTIVTGYGTVAQTVLLSSAGSHVDLDTVLGITSVVATKPVLVVIVTLNNKVDGCMSVLISDSHLTERHYAKFPDGAQNAQIYLQLQENITSTLVKDYDIQSQVWRTSQGSSGEVETKGNSIKMGDSKFPFRAIMFGIGDHKSSRFCTSLGRKVSELEEVCSPTEQSMGDGKDNDCDGLVDEEILITNFYKYDTNANVDGGYIPDFDLDGIMDEDCFSEITVTSSTEIYSTTMVESSMSITEMITVTESDSLSLMTATISDGPSVITATASDGPSVMTATALDGPSASKCYCPCGQYKPPDPSMLNITKEKLESIVEETKKKLAVNKTVLSSYIRKKNSAKDSRPSAAGIGSFGIIVLVFIVVVLVGLDLMFLKQHLQSVRRYKF